VDVADANTAWAVGSKGIIKRYDGTAWSVERQPVAGADTLRAVAALSSQRAWAGGSELSATVAAYHTVKPAVACAIDCLLCRILCCRAMRHMTIAFVLPCPNIHTLIE
jgi:hypothetical protein